MTWDMTGDFAVDLVLIHIDRVSKFEEALPEDPKWLMWFESRKNGGKLVKVHIVHTKTGQANHMQVSNIHLEARQTSTVDMQTSFS